MTLWYEMHCRTLFQSLFRSTLQNTALPKHSRLEAHLVQDSKYGIRQFAQFESAPGMQQTSNYTSFATPTYRRTGTEWPREINLRVLGTNLPLRKTYFCPKTVPSFHSTDAGGCADVSVRRHRMRRWSVQAERAVLCNNRIMRGVRQK